MKKKFKNNENLNKIKANPVSSKFSFSLKSLSFVDKRFWSFASFVLILILTVGSCLMVNLFSNKKIEQEALQTASLTKPTLATSSFIYTGSTINLITQNAINGYDSTAMNISGHSQTNVGNSYLVTFSLKDTSTQEWSDGTTESFSLSWSITQATNSWIISPSIASWYFGESASTPVGLASFGTVVRYYKLSNALDSAYTTTVPSEPGNYKMKSVVEATANYTGLVNTSAMFSVREQHITSVYDYVELSTISTQDGGEYTSLETTVDDYFYFPSYDDMNSNFGLINDNLRLCMPTDWSIANKAYFALSGRDGMGTNRATTGTGSWWSRSALSSSKVQRINATGGFDSSNASDEVRANRVVAHFSINTVKYALAHDFASIETITFQSQTFKILTIEHLMYPQKKVSNAELIQSLDAIANDDDYKTGKSYAGYTTSISANGRTTHYSEEYKYNGEYYVYVPQYANLTNATYSDGTNPDVGGASYVWIKVEPVQWVIYNWDDLPTSINADSSSPTATYIEVYSMYGIVCGMQFYPNNSHPNATSWSSSVWRAFLNGYDLSKKTDQYMSTILVNFEEDGFIDVLFHDLTIFIEKPTLSQSVFEYSSAITITSYASHYQPFEILATGDITETNWGIYYVTFSLRDADSYRWADDTDDSFVVRWVIRRASLAKPTLSGNNLTFSGSPQGPTKANYNSSTMYLSGTETATMAGAYTTTITPRENYVWSDGTTTPVTLNWTISKLELTTPSLQISSFDFVPGGDNQRTVTIVDQQSTYTETVGELTASKVGEYYIVIAIKNEYKSSCVFENGKTVVKLRWVINAYSLEEATIVIGAS